MFAQSRVKNLESRIKVFFLSILSIILYSLFIIQPASAQTASYAPLPSTISPTSPLFTDLLMQNVFHTFSCLAVGSSVIGQPCLTYISGVPVLSKTNLSGGALGATTSLISMLYVNPPVRTANYLASVGENLGIVKEAHAQVTGSGAGVLDPILKLWQVSRNISYLIMIIIFVIIGLMVMFRQRINPQTVITAQAALPGLVIGLILITFSYFLASLLTDTAFIATDLVGYYFQTAQKIPAGTQETLSKSLANQNILSILTPFLDAVKRADINKALDSVWNAIISRSDTSTAANIIRSVTALGSYQFGASVGPALGQLTAGGLCLAAVPFGGPLAAITIFTVPLCAKIGEVAGTFIAPGALAATGFANPPFIISFVVTFVLIFIILYSIGKLLLRLINCYLTIIFLTVTGPFSLLAASLPGRQGIATDWVRNILCNVLSFPAVAAVIYFAGYLLGNSVSNLPGIRNQANLTTSANLPLFGGLDLNFLNLLLAFGAIIALPSIPDIICRSVGKPGQGMGIFVGELQGNVGAGRGQGAQFNQRLGAVTADVGNYRKKWYEDPYEPRGLGPRIGYLSGTIHQRPGAGPFPEVRKTIRTGLSKIFRGQTPEERRRQPNQPEDTRQD